MTRKSLPARAADERGGRGANQERIANAKTVFCNAVSQATVEGFYGEVRVCVTLQDGVIQKLNVENSRVIRS